MKLVAFGEIMLRLTPPGYARLEQSASLEARFGGAEANVAVAYARFGGNAMYVTALPDNPLGRAARNAVRACGVDTSAILFGGSRLGTYYVERGSGQRPSVVVYDRAGSSVATMSPDAYRWEELLAGAGCFFYTGITPALSEDCRAAVTAAVWTAHEMGIPVACDINYRSKLWSVETAGEVMRPLAALTDILIVNEEHAERVLAVPSAAIPAGLPLAESLAARHENCATMTEKLRERYGTRTVAMTLRTTISAEETMTGAVLRDEGGVYHSPDYRIRAVDRVGSGDAYTGGLLYALSQGESGESANRFAAASCALKHTVEGDFQMMTEEEVRRLAENADARIQR